MGCILTHLPLPSLLGTHLGLPFYYILRKLPAYPFITAYPFIRFDEKVQPTRLLEPTLY